MNSLSNNQINNAGSVYVIDFGDRVKIGCSRRPKTRIKEVSSYLNNYAGLRAKDSYFSEMHKNFRENEKKLHDYFSDFRLGNSEMFSVPIDSVIFEMNHNLFFENDFKAEKEKNFRRSQILINTFDYASTISSKNRLEKLISDETDLNNYIDSLILHAEQMETIREYLYSDLSNEDLTNKLRGVSCKYREMNNSDD